MKDALGHGSNSHASGIEQAVPRMPLRQGDQFEMRGGVGNGKAVQRYSVKSQWPPPNNDLAEGEEMVLAHRYIKGRQKFSGTAYVVRVPKEARRL